jgi:tryptophan synthase alpha subunit
VAPIVRLWAHPGSWSPQAVPALRAARQIRAAVGFGVQSIEQWQAKNGLEADGIVGKKTLQTVGIV